MVKLYHRCASSREKQDLDVCLQPLPPPPPATETFASFQSALPDRARIVLSREEVE